MVLSIFGGSICVNQFFSYTLCPYYWCNYLVSYLIAVSKNLISILAFCTSSSQLHPATVGRRRRKLGSTSGTWFEESQWGH